MKQWLAIPLALYVGACCDAAELRLRDGSVVHGTILRLVDGDKLTVDTRHMDQVTIDWDAIESITDTEVVEVELFDGRQVLGKIVLEGGVLTVDDGAALIADPGTVFAMSEVNETFGERLTAYTDLGSNFVRGNNRVSQVSLGAGLGYTAPTWSSSLRVSSIVNEQTNAENTRRLTMNADYSRDLADRWQAVGFFQFEADEQQRLDGRSLLGGGVGRRLLNQRQHRLSAYGGLVLNVEQFEGAPQNESTEAFLELRYRLRWRFDADLSYTVFPSLEESDRVRTQFDGSLSVDLLSDLDFRLTVYDRYDSRPPPGNKTNDSGLTMGLRWEY